MIAKVWSSSESPSAGTGAGDPLDFALVGAELAGDHLEQSGFTGPVAADQADALAALDEKTNELLIKNVFFNKAPLHDGALIVRDCRLYAAGCLLPLSSNMDIVKDLGTRHRAAIGMSENSDAVVIAVSEETGQISLAINGVLTRDYTRMKLKYALEKEIFYEDPDYDKSNKKGISSIIGRRKKK